MTTHIRSYIYGTLLENSMSQKFISNDPSCSI